MVESDTPMTEKILTYDELDISLHDIYEQMGYQDETPDSSVVYEVSVMLSDIRRWLKPQMAFSVMRGVAETEENSLRLYPDSNTEGVIFRCGRIVTRQVRQAEAFCIFVCTAGTEYQELMERLTEEGDMVRLYIAHAIGSVIAERCADNMEQVLQRQIEKLSWRRTNRFSPGYCGWNVSEQRMLFPLFHGHTAGVTLTPSSLMMPIKSVSGIIGLGRDVKYLEYTCGLCDYKDCYKRRNKKNT